MPAFKTEVPHSLSQEDARERVDQMKDSIHEQYPGLVSDLSSEWNENTLSLQFSVYGFKIKSALEVQVQCVIVNGNIPLAALPFKGKVQQTIGDKLSELLG